MNRPRQYTNDLRGVNRNVGIIGLPLNDPVARYLRHEYDSRTARGKREYRTARSAFTELLVSRYQRENPQGRIREQDLPRAVNALMYPNLQGRYADMYNLEHRMEANIRSLGRNRNELTIDDLLREDEEGLYMLTYDRWHLKDYNMPDFIDLQPNQRMYIRSSRFRLENDIARLQDVDARRVDGEDIPAWVHSLHIRDSILQDELPPGVDLATQRMYTVENVVGYSALKCDRNMVRAESKQKKWGCVKQALLDYYGHKTNVYKMTASRIDAVINLWRRHQMTCCGMPGPLRPKLEFPTGRELDRMIQHDQSLLQDVGGITPLELTAVFEMWGINSTCFDTQENKLTRFINTKVSSKYEAFHYVTNSQHMYIITDLHAKAHIGAINGNESKGHDMRTGEKNDFSKKGFAMNALKDKHEEQAFMQVFDTLEQSTEKWSNTSEVYLTREEDLTNFCRQTMKEKRIIFHSKRYRFNDEGHMVEFMPREGLVYRVNQHVREVLKVCEAFEVPFRNQSMCQLAISLLSDIHKKGDFMKGSVMNDTLFSQIMRDFRPGHAGMYNKPQDESKLVGYDFNKMYSSILRDEILPRFDVFAEPEEVIPEEVIMDTSYYVIRDLVIPPEVIPAVPKFGKWTSGYYGFILKILEEQGCAFKIVHRFKPTGRHASFKNDAIRIYKVLCDKYGEQEGMSLGKCVFNTFIGLMGKNRRFNQQIYFDTCERNLATMVANHLQKDSNDMVGMSKTMEFDDDGFQNVSLYEAVRLSESFIINSNLPAHIFIIQRGWAMLYRLVQRMTKGRPDARVILVETDYALVENGNSDLVCSKEIGGIKKVPLEACIKKLSIPYFDFEKKEAKSRPRTIEKPPVERKEHAGSMYRRIPGPVVNEWKMIDVNESEWEDPKWAQTVAEKILELGSCRLSGRAGTGKTHVGKAFIRLLNERKIVHAKCAFTNNASLLLGGQTIHRTFGLNKCDPIEKANQNILSRDQWLILDESSLIPTGMYNIFAIMKARGVKVLVIGDYDQLPPVDFDGRKLDYDKSLILKQLCNNHQIQLKINKRSEQKMFDLCRKILNDDFDVDDFLSDDSVPTLEETHICYRNKVANAVNQILMRNKGKTLGEKEKLKFAYVESYEDEEPTLAKTCWKGMKLISRHGISKLKIVNNERFILKDWDEVKQTAVLDREDAGENERTITVEFKHLRYDMVPGYAMTCHRAQGRTVTGKIRIWDWDFHRVTKKWHYTAVTRTTSWANVFFSPILPRKFPGDSDSENEEDYDDTDDDEDGAYDNDAMDEVDLMYAEFERRKEEYLQNQ